MDHQFDITHPHVSLINLPPLDKVRLINILLINYGVVFLLEQRVDEVNAVKMLSDFCMTLQTAMSSQPDDVHESFENQASGIVNICRAVLALCGQEYTHHGSLCIVEWLKNLAATSQWHVVARAIASSTLRGPLCERYTKYAKSNQQNQKEFAQLDNGIPTELMLGSPSGVISCVERLDFLS